MLYSNVGNGTILTVTCLGLFSAIVTIQAQTQAHSPTALKNDDNEKPVSFTQIGVDEKKPQRIREGEVIRDEHAKVKSDGLRYTIILSKGHQKYIVLENLALERISDYLAKSGGDSTWLIEGTVTEFQGSNYIMLTRAHVNSLADESDSRAR